MASTSEHEIDYPLYRESDADEMAILLSSVSSESDPPAFAGLAYFLLENPKQFPLLAVSCP
jgi:hypothetical protein